MKLLFVGDVVGRSGRKAVCEHVPALRERLNVDFVIANGENAAGGFGITPKICDEFFDAGVDVITTGNHVWDRKEIFTFIDNEERLLRPCNYPSGTPGRGVGLYELPGDRKVVVVQVMGRVFMDPLDDPFARIDDELAPPPTGARGRRHRRRRARRGDEREECHGSLCRRTGLHGRGNALSRADGGCPHPCRRDRLPNRSRDVR